MGTPIEYIYEHALQLQPSFNGALNVSGRFGYRGDLIVAAADPEKTQAKVSPKAVMKHAIVIDNGTDTLMFAGALADFSDFEAFFERYKPILNADTLVTIFVDNLLSDALFEYEGVNVHAFSLDESSVWNELLSHADLDKKELKKMSAEDKLDTLYDGLLDARMNISSTSYEAACELKIA